MKHKKKSLRPRCKIAVKNTTYHLWLVLLFWSNRSNVEQNRKRNRLPVRKWLCQQFSQKDWNLRPISNSGVEQCCKRKMKYIKIYIYRYIFKNSNQKSKIEKVSDLVQKSLARVEESTSKASSVSSGK